MSDGETRKELHCVTTIWHNFGQNNQLTLRTKVCANRLRGLPYNINYVHIFRKG